MAQSHCSGFVVAGTFAKHLGYCATLSSFEKHILTLSDADNVTGRANKLYSYDFAAIFELKSF